MTNKIRRKINQFLCRHSYTYSIDQETMDFIIESEARQAAGEKVSYAYTIHAVCSRCNKETYLGSDLMY